VSTGHVNDHQPGVVSLLDADAAVREILGRMLRPSGWELRLFGSPSEFMTAPRPPLPACVVLEASLPGDSGLELQRKLLEAGDRTPLIFVTGHGNLAMGVSAMKAGAVDFLTKPVSEPDLLAAVRLALQRDALQRREGERLEEVRRRIASLSPREAEVMRRVVRGVLNKKIATELAIAEITVKVHRRHVMDKMGAQSLADLVRMVDRAEPGTD
jgi:FixJ family two-component response regulator